MPRRNGCFRLKGQQSIGDNAYLLATAKGLSEAQKIRAADQLEVGGTNFLDMNALDFVVDHVIL